jgi:Tol biopolymer transport system component
MSRPGAVRARKPLLLTLVAGLVLAVPSAPVSGQGAPLGIFEGHGDVGNPAIAGSATYNGATQEYHLSAAGVNMWAQRDEFQFVWKKMSGDFILQARVEFLGTGVDPHRKAGVIVRPTMDADAPYVDGMLHGDGLTSLQFRRTRGAITEQIESAAKGSDVVQIERKGNAYIMSVAKFGEPFTVSQVADIALGDEVYVGLALCSHNAAVVERAIFRDVRLTRPAAENFRPYRDYIGSVLELLDVETGRRQVIYRNDQPFEAPNWTNDGSALIFNTSGSDPDWRGRLHRFDLLTRRSTIIDTATNIRNNNDHVLSPDGTMLAISDQSQGGSTIYTVPVTGGVPKRITTLTPSYMHSWSPDAKWLVYTGGRPPAQGQPNNLDIYRIASDGSGTEERLTTAVGVDDGPEYTPDGRFIYFNSVRSGTMQIWRMSPDGSNQERVTNDDFNNWFPHISPDGRSIMIISFPKDIDPADHPYYKRVYLRVMPIGGGTPRVVAYVYGGQGTINVPSWSPDSRLVAFVSNTGPLP